MRAVELLEVYHNEHNTISDPFTNIAKFIEIVYNREQFHPSF